MAGALGLAGEYTSSNTIPGALTAPIFGLPMCSGSATSNELSNKAMYPLFLRAIAPDASMGEFLASFCAYMGWTNVNIISSVESYGISLSTSFQNAAAARNITISRSAQVQLTWTSAQYQSLVASLASSPTRVTIVAMWPQYFIPVMLQAYAAGFGSEWTWVGADVMTVVMSVLQTSSNPTPSVLAYFEGILSVFPTEIDPSSNQYRRLSAKWTNQFGDDMFNTTPYALFGAACLEVMARGFLTVANRVGVSALVSRAYNVTLDDFLSPVETVTGRAVFSPLGDRIGVYQVLNIQKGTNVPVYESNTTGLIRQISTPYFADGTSAIPSWRPKTVTIVPGYSDPVVILLIVLVTGVMVATCASFAALVHYRGSLRVGHVGIEFAAVMAFGILVSLASVPVFAGPPTPLKCGVAFWSMQLGLTACISGLAARMFQIYQVFDNQLLSKSLVMSKKVLGVFFAGFMGAQLLIMCVQLAAAPTSPGSVVNGATVAVFCTYPSVLQQGLVCATTGLIVLALLGITWISYKVRHVHTPFSETSYLVYTVHHVLFAIITTFALSAYFNSSPYIAFYIKGVALLYANGAMLISMVLRHAVALVQAKGTSSLASQRALQAVSTQNLSNSTRASENGSRSALFTQKQAVKTYNHLHGVYPIQIGTGLFRKWVETHITLYADEGILAIHSVSDQSISGSSALSPQQRSPRPSSRPPPSTTTSATTSSSARALLLRRCLMDADPVDVPHCIVLTLGNGVEAVSIKYPASVERQRWAAALASTGIGGGIGESSRRGSGSGGSGGKSGNGQVTSRSRAASLVDRIIKGGKGVPDVIGNDG
ncbi:periplasmic binding protein-like I [Blastocladiella britannica]|nr:periplasmic binding protein-like I [Blastocladiella britannica]